MIDWITDIREKPALDPRQYAFSYTNGAGASGNLASAGAGKVITFTRLPFGLAVNNYIRLSGGTGTAEAALITAVSGVADGAGTITVTTGNTHTGLWVVSTSSTGVMEAIMATGGSGRVQMTSGTVMLYAPITIPANYNVSLRGMGQGNTLIRTVGVAGNWINFAVSSPFGAQPYIDLGDFSIIDDSGTMHTSGSMIKMSGKAYGLVNNIEIENAFDGIIADTCPGTVTVDSVHIGCVRYGIYITTLGVHYPTVPQSGGNFSNFRVNTTGAVGASIKIEGPTTAIVFTNGTVASTPPSSTNYCLEINTTSADVQGEVMFSNCIFDSAGQAIRITGDSTAFADNWYIFDGCELNATEAAILISGKVQNVYWNGGLIKASDGTLNYPVQITNGPRNIQIRDTSMYGTGAYAVALDNCTDVLLSNITVGWEGNGPLTGVGVSTNVTRLKVVNCDLSKCTTAKVASVGGASVASVSVTDFTNSYVVTDLLAFANGSIVMCSDGTVANPVAGSGTGCLAKRLNGAWVGN